MINVILNELRKLLLKNIINVTIPGLNPKHKTSLSPPERLFLVGNKAYETAKPGKKYARDIAIMAVKYRNMLFTG